MLEVVITIHDFDDEENRPISTVASAATATPRCVIARGGVGYDRGEMMTIEQGNL